MVLAAHPKRKSSPHAVKRHAGHHRQTKHYSKTYWPYLTMLAVAVCGFLLNGLWTPSRQVLGYTSDVSGSSLLQHTNLARLDNNTETLTLNEQLSKAAQKKAEDMATRNYWSHATPEGNQPWHFAQQAGYGYTAFGENLAYGFDGSAATVNAWMSSPEHRANILSKQYQEIGFGITNAKDYLGKGETTIIVAMYGTPNLAPNAAGAKDIQGAMLPIRNVSRVETISTTNAALIAVTTAIVAASGAMFVALKHGIILRRVLIKGEVFIVKHHILDLILLGAGGVGFVMTRSAGIIH